MSQPTRRVLLIGEHLDGHWVDVPTSAYTQRAAKPFWVKDAALAQTSGDTCIPFPEYVDYRIERMPIAIRSARADIWIGIASTLHGPDRDLAIVRAIFQRDVAQQFKESW